MAAAVDLVTIPFHDWRKVQREGTRTRDSHLIKHCIAHPQVGRVIIVNRPISWPEMLYKRSPWRTEGTVIARSHNSQLAQLDERAYVVDFRSADFLSPIFKGKGWFLKAHRKAGFVSAVQKYLRLLNVTEFDVISFSLTAAGLSEQLGGRRKLFDGWDNFLRFPDHQRYFEDFRAAYASYAGHSDNWTTNSESNREFFEREFGVRGCRVIRNGVDVERFRQTHEVPSDLADISRPIIGVGAKITHLLDTYLINRILETHPKTSFVLVGQMLDKSVFRRIRKTPNFHYLGDKNYDDYVGYVQGFDVGLIPYVVGDREHGGDSIKFYEYLAAGKPIISTAIEGVTDDFDNVFVASDHDEFCAMIPQALAAEPTHNDLPEELTWRYKANELLKPLLV